MKIAVAQIDTTIGDFSGNTRKILDLGRRAEREGADLVLFPELAVCGYPPRDLVERRAFVSESERTAARIARSSGRALWLYGSIEHNPARAGRRVFNAAIAAREGRIVARYHKRLLPTYDVFDEGRYIEPGRRPLVLRLRGRRIGVTICEDIWNDKTFWKHPLYPTDPVRDMKPLKLDLHANISASPWTLGKARLRERMMKQIARQTGVPLVSCNLVGGNDNLVFDGGSAAFNRRGRLVARGESFREDFWMIPLPDGTGPVRPRETDIARLRSALVLALSDYAAKCGFSSAVLGLSGGIDSAVTATLAAEALGADRVVGVAMPGPYSSPGSLRDARDLAGRLGIRLLEISILPVFEAYRKVLASAPDAGSHSPVEENIQARIRGAILMALSNRFGHLVLSTGNKSEIAVGYCTLYASITKEPSAELKPNQKDSDSLPPYDALDPLIEALVDLSLPPPAAARRAGVAAALARDIARRIDRNEYKRRQMPPGPKVTARGFGEGRRYPIAQKFEV
jgi:NAD+ synthase (glutamine-hydrolysing)